MVPCLFFEKFISMMSMIVMSMNLYRDELDCGEYDELEL